MLRILAFFIDIALLFEALSSANWTGYIRSAEGVRQSEADGLFSAMCQGNQMVSRCFSRLRLIASSVARTTLCISCTRRQAEPERMR